MPTMPTTTCAQSSHMRHPWFHTFAAKRKVPSPDDCQQSVKRRKYSTLEHGFAHLTLIHDPLAPKDMDVPMDSSDMVAPEVSDHVVYPSSVEEPTDIRMRTSTWYEPEPDRIVVTELESSDEEQDPKQDEGQLYVSPALLNHIRSRTFSQNSYPIQSTSQALVLFRPLLLPDNTGGSRAALTTGTPMDSIHKKQSVDIKEEDDIMDVEP